MYWHLENSLIAAVLLCCAFVSAYILVRFINKTNRQLSYFFNAVENNDSSIVFPQDVGDKSYRKLYESLNRVNNKIQEARIESGIKEQYFKTVVEHSATGIVSFDRDGNIETLNSSAKELLSCGTIGHISKFENDQVRVFFESADGVKSQTVITKINGKVRHLKFNVASIAFYGKQMSIVSVQDIRSEIDTKELESWIKLIRILTHEIMNSIAPITSIAATLKGYFKETDYDISESMKEDTRDGLEVIEEQGERLMHFVQSYRTLSKLPDPQFETVSVETMLNKMKYLFSDKANEINVDIDISVAPYDLEITIDEKLINHVLVNLVKNGLQAMEENNGGVLKLHAQRLINGKTIVMVADSGCGIEQELLDKIFIPFFTTKEEGTGIGLSLARQIMHQHGGSIDVQQTDGETQFLLMF